MKVIAFNGSARKDGNTAKLINYAFEELNREVSIPNWCSCPAVRYTAASPATSASAARTAAVR